MITYQHLPIDGINPFPGMTQNYAEDLKKIFDSLVMSGTKTALRLFQDILVNSNFYDNTVMYSDSDLIRQLKYLDYIDASDEEPLDALYDKMFSGTSTLAMEPPIPNIPTTVAAPPFVPPPPVMPIPVFDEEDE